MFINMLSEGTEDLCQSQVCATKFWWSVYYALHPLLAHTVYTGTRLPSRGLEPASNIKYSYLI